MPKKPKATVVSTLKELLELQSHSHHDRRAIADYAQAWLENIGMDVSRHGEDSLPAICATNGSGGMILSGHLDTVPIGSQWTQDQGAVEGGRIYGRGAADMKGAVASMLHASTTLMRKKVPFTVFLTTDEEDKMTGAFALSELDLL
ncbi:MAG TPA: M20/M25/M40 family metallo-hydrolase, partial [Methanomassiliicoccales archaeon]|nr:M20/M25/M40 family metallo-hydrolase [Methanomassiliicoccales archaeon]